jgi:hypothetical protein
MENGHAVADAARMSATRRAEGWSLVGIVSFANQVQVQGGLKTKNATRRRDQKSCNLQCPLSVIILC